MIDSKVTKSILTHPEEYNGDLKEKEKLAVLREMLAQEEELARAAEDAESSLGRQTSPRDSKQVTQNMAGETFNALPLPK